MIYSSDIIRIMYSSHVSRIIYTARIIDIVLDVLKFVIFFVLGDHHLLQSSPGDFEIMVLNMDDFLLPEIVDEYVQEKC